MQPDPIQLAMFIVGLALCLLFVVVISDLTE